MDDLQFFTTKDLIHEIMNRKTFQGVIIHAEGDYKSQEWVGAKNFKVHYNNNLEKKETCAILEVLSQTLEEDM
jgi:hypothetical protein